MCNIIPNIRLAYNYIHTIPEITTLHLPKYNLLNGQRTSEVQICKKCLNNDIKDSSRMDSFQYQIYGKPISGLYNFGKFAFDLTHYYQEYAIL